MLRYWETEFPMLQPVKSPKGHRLYRREDVDTVLRIKRLLYDEGFTIAGARRHLREEGDSRSGSRPRATAAGKGARTRGGTRRWRQRLGRRRPAGRRQRMAERRPKLRNDRPQSSAGSAGRPARILDASRKRVIR